MTLRSRDGGPSKVSIQFSKSLNPCRAYHRRLARSGCQAPCGFFRFSPVRVVRGSAKIRKGRSAVNPPVGFFLAFSARTHTARPQPSEAMRDAPCALDPDHIVDGIRRGPGNNEESILRLSSPRPESPSARWRGKGAEAPEARLGCSSRHVEGASSRAHAALPPLDS